MKKNNIQDINTKKLRAYFLLTSLEAFLAGIYLLKIPADPKNQWLWGYSQGRIVLFVSFFFVFLIFLLETLLSLKKGSRATQYIEAIISEPLLNQKLQKLFYAMLMAVILLLLIPEYRLGGFFAYMERLRPLLGYLALVGLQTIFLLKVSLKQNAGKFSREKASLFIMSLLPLFIILSIWLGISKTGTGIRGDWDLWREAGVPLLLTQILSGTIFVVLLKLMTSYISEKTALLTSKKWQMLSPHKTKIIGFGIWLVTFLLWTKEPLVIKNFFFPGPYPPNNSIYPFADPATWDIFGQFALIGEHFARGNAFADHIGLSGFEAILHLLVGQDYSQIILFQIMLYALFPVILYLLGDFFHSGKMGLFLTWISVLHQINAFESSNMINQSNAKSMLTEFPTGLGLSLISLWLFIWLKNKPQKKIAYILPISGVLAILILLRLNALALPIALLAGLLVFFGKSWKITLKISILSLVTILFVLSPWMWRSWRLSGNPFFFTGKASAIFNENFRLQSTPSQPNMSETTDYASLFVPNATDRKLSVRRVSSIAEGRSTIPVAVLNHFTHNLITSILILPTTPFLHDVRHTIYEISPYWNKIGGYWRGDMPPWQMLGLLLNIAIISIGLGFAWQKWKLAGLIPLGVYATYNFATALARTSGGRYIVPVQWVVLFYFSIGIAEVISLIFATFKTKTEKESLTIKENSFSYKRGIAYVLPFFLFVSTITIIDQIIPQHYPPLSKEAVLEKIIRGDLLNQSGISPQELSDFLTTSNAVAYFGRSLFPRYYLSQKGEATAQKTAYSPDSFPRLGFTFIGPFGTGQAVLPLDEAPSSFPHAEDIIVIGCKKATYPAHGVNIFLDALMVIILDEDDVVLYTSDTTTTLQCPFSSN